ncbi:MAG: PAS domain S-box protein [Bacteroidales bacterium]|jgi:PAS domain S-box-containing protein|nr:PAS domain S-box protein [Bacteroidales bacterium]
MSCNKDITEHIKTEKALNETEEQYRLLFENTGEAILLTNPDGQIYSANPEACRIFCISEEEICNLGRTGVVDLNDPNLEPALNERKKTGKFKGELNLLRKDGTVFPAEVISTVFMDSSGNERTSMIIRDITERKQADEALLKSEELFRIVISNAPISIFATDRDGIFILHEGKALTKVGMKSGENVGVSAYKLFADLKVVEHNGNVTQGKSVLDRVLNGETLSGITELNDVIFDNQFVPIIDNKGNVMGLIGVATDVSERIKAEKTLRESEVRFRSLFENSLLGISIANPEGKLIHVNMAYAKMYGYKNPEEMLAIVTDVKQLYANPKERKEVIRILQTKGFMKGREFELIRRSGSHFFVLVSACEIRGSDGKLLYNQATHIDLTERKKMEEKLRKSKELLENLNQHLTDIRENERAVISREIHDQVGQSLTALKIDMTWLRQKITSESEESRKLNEMIELVNVISMDVHRISFELRPVMLDDLGLAAALECYCEEFANRTGLKIQMEIEDVQTENIDRNLSIYRVAQESLTNIVRHADAKKVQIKLRKIKKDIVLLIQDDGIGISPDKIRSSKSLGFLGMSERVNQSGGHMEIKAPDKGGTKVSVYIPIK